MKSKQEKIKVAILTRPSYRSPRVLAEGLQRMLSRLNIESHIFYNGVPMIYIPSNWKGRNFVKNTIEAIKYRVNVFSLKRYDMIVICYTIPDAFKKRFAVEELRRFVSSKPVILYEVAYLNNCPNWLGNLGDSNDFGVERYDWHLSVSRVTETSLKPGEPCTVIGLDLDKKEFYPQQKQDFIALIDFERKGYEKYRKVQLEALSELGIKTIILDSEYTFSEMAEIYRKCSIYFLASYEAFGVPIAELQVCGAYMFSPSPTWPMALRLDPYCPNVSAGKLSENFIIYKSKADLKNKIVEIRKKYNPNKVFDNFIKNYPHFYKGDTTALEEIIHKLAVKT